MEAAELSVIYVDYNIQRAVGASAPAFMSSTGHLLDVETAAGRSASVAFS